MRKTILTSILASMFALCAHAGNTTTTVTQVTEGVDLTTDVDYVITSEDEPFTTAGSVNIVNTDHAVVIFKYIKPSVVISDYLDHIYINGEPAVSDDNCQVKMYNTGAIVLPYDDTAALICYTEENYGGESYDGYRIGNSGGYMLSLTSSSLNNSIRSFKLKRGYMVTFAVGSAGWGYSRCFIADQEDLEVPSVPAPLNGKISSYRLFRWFNAQKKGLGSDTDRTVNGLLNTSWCYTWSLGSSRLPDVECVPNHIYEDWPSSSSCGGVTYSCHLKTNNEPGNSSDDTPQDVETVLANWQNLMRTGLRLCSETSHDGSMSHLKNFMDSIDAYGWRCDLVDLHCYWASGTFSSLDWYSDYYGGSRPIWISEWVWGASWNSNGIFGSAPDGTGSYSLANQQACYNGTKPILDILNSNPRVERYAYWNSEANCSKIYVYGGDTSLTNNGLTILGEYYAGMDTGLGYNESLQIVPTIVFSAPGSLSCEYTKKTNTAELTWSDPNGDMLDSIVVQYKYPGGSSRWETLAHVTLLDQTSKAGAEYTYVDTLSHGGGIYYYRVVEYYTNSRGNSTNFTTNEVSATSSLANNVGALQFGTLEIASSDEVTTDIVEQDEAPYVVLGMVSNKNTSNGITNHLVQMSKSSFRFFFEPWELPSPVDISSAETIDYIILPPDTVFHLSDDMMLISQKVGNVKGDDVEVLFPEAFPEGVTPVVVAQQNVITSAYPPVTVKVFNVTNEGFTVKLVRQEGVTSSSFSTENVNYFACSPGQIAVGEGKLLTVGRDYNDPVGGSGRTYVYYTNEEGDTLRLLNPYIVSAPQTNNYPAASVFRQHSTSSDDDGVYRASIRRQTDSTSTTSEADRASTNGDYIGWFIISDDPEGGENTAPLITTAIQSVVTDKGFNVYSSDGCLWTDNPSLRAYTTAGVQVRFGEKLPDGIYIITDGRQSRKLLLKK